MKFLDAKLNNRIDYLVAGIILCTALLAYASFTRDGGWDGDNASYIMQAKSIVDANPEKFIELNEFAMKRSLHVIGPVAYPWGYPLLLAPIYAVFGMNLLALKCLNLFFYLLFLMILWINVRNRLATPFALLTVILFAFNPYFLNHLNHIMSDIPFLLFSTGSLFLIEHIVIEKRQVFTPSIDYLFLGFLLICTVFIRTNGILLFPALLAAQVMSLMQDISIGGNSKETASVFSIFRLFASRIKKIHPKNAINALLPYFIFLVPVAVWQMTHTGGSSSHISFLRMVALKTIINNVVYYIELPSIFFSGTLLSPLFIGGIMCPFLISGILQDYLKDLHILIYVLLTFFLYLIWPFKQGIRYFFPILPFFLYWVFSGINKWIMVYGKQKQQTIVKVIIGIFFVFLVGNFMQKSVVKAVYNIKADRRSTEGVFSEKANAMFCFIKEKTDVDDIIIFFKPRIMTMRTNRQSLLIDKTELLCIADYLCCYSGKRPASQISASDIQKLKSKGRLEEIYSNDLLQLYKINCKR